jgi:hypothetical protein
MTPVLAYQHKHMPNKQFLCANIVIGCILNPKTNTFIRPARYNVATSSGATFVYVQTNTCSNCNTISRTAE